MQVLPFALRERPQRGGIGQQRLEELERNDLVSLVDHGVDPGHADILEHLQMLEVVVREGHPETGAFESLRRKMLRQGLELLVEHEIDVLRADSVGKVHRLPDGKRLGLDPLAVLPVSALGGHFTDVDFGIEVGGKRLSVVAGVRVDDVKRLNGVEMVLHRPRGIDIGHAGIEPAAEKRHDALLPEAVLIRPLPLVFKMRNFGRLVVRGVDVVDAGFETGVHDMQVLIGKREIQHDIGPDLPDEFNELRHIVGIHLFGPDVAVVFRLDLRGKRIAFGFRSARKADVREDVRRLCALVHRHSADAACADNQNSCHGFFS